MRKLLALILVFAALLTLSACSDSDKEKKSSKPASKESTAIDIEPETEKEEIAVPKDEVQETIKALVAAIEKKDAAKITAMHSNTAVDFEEASYTVYSYYDYEHGVEIKKTTFENSIKSKLEALSKELEEETGAGYVLNYEVSESDIKKLSSEEVEESNNYNETIFNNLNDRLKDGKTVSFDKTAITNISEIKIRTTATANDRNQGFDIYLTLVQEKGSWKIWEMYWDI